MAEAMNVLQTKKQKKISSFFSLTVQQDVTGRVSTDDDDDITDRVSTDVNVQHDVSVTDRDHDTRSQPTQKKRKHEFQDNWKTDRPWLKLNENKDMMICSFCSETGKTNTFTSGCSNFRTSTLDRHVECSQHRQALLDLKASKDLQKATANSYKRATDSFTNAIAMVYWLAKENLATAKYESAIDFLDFLKVDVQSMTVGSNATYRSRTTAEELQEAISATIENDILDKIARSPFISLLTDESTDISNSKKMVVYIRSFDSDTFVASTNFLGNIEIQESSTTAEVLFHHLTKFLHDKNIPMDKIIGFGSDGASVMTGSKSGVATRFREKCPHLVNIHCMAHRFNLCTSQASKNITYLKDIFEKTFKDLYYYFDKSGNRVAELKEIQQVLDGPTLKIKQVHEIRWLAFYDALYAVFHSWEALVKYFKKQNKTKTQLELYQAITDYRFVVFMHIMMDIIPNLAEMSMLLQKENLDISVVMPQLDNINRVLDNVDRSCTSTYYQRMLSENLDTSGQKPKFKKVQLYIHRSTTAKTVSDIQTDKKAFIAALKCQLNARFPPASKSISTAFAVLGLRNLSHLSSDDIDAYGEKGIEQLCDYYGQTKTVNDVSSPAKIRPVALPVQWKLAKTVILREKYPRDRMPSLWKDVHDFHADSFPDLLTLASIALVMPYQTADCERGFSKQNLTKSPSRNRLGEQAMNRLLMISIEGPPIREFNFNRALCVYKRGNRKASYLKK